MIDLFMREIDFFFFIEVGVVNEFLHSTCIYGSFGSIFDINVV